MKSAEQNKMRFYEIGKGSFARKMQAFFEEAQYKALENNVTVKLVSTITVGPPSSDDMNFGNLMFEVKLKWDKPVVTSRVYSTELKEGMIISDGIDVADLLQTKLEFPDISPQTKEGTNNVR